MKTDLRPIVVVGVAILIVWYAAAIALNAPLAAAEVHGAGEPSSAWTLATRTLAVSRPILPAPDKIVVDLARSIFGFSPADPHNILYHVAVTAFSTLLGFVLGSIIGMLLAIGIVHAGALEASLMPWIVASQTVPILAIAPMAVVILGNLGLVGVLPKALISAYLSFFPVAIAAVKGLRSTDRRSGSASAISARSPTGPAGSRIACPFSGRGGEQQQADEGGIRRRHLFQHRPDS
jgi:NitT/TauT family transport system permease protein